MERLGDTPMLIARTPSVIADRNLVQTVSLVFWLHALRICFGVGVVLAPRDLRRTLLCCGAPPPLMLGLCGLRTMSSEPLART